MRNGISSCRREYDHVIARLIRCSIAPMNVQASFRFFSELNDFLQTEFRQRAVARPCPPGATVKHMIEVFGVPHTEVELILVNGESVGFDRRVEDGDRVDVYPAFSALDVTRLIRLPARPLQGDRFVADSHLGRLARQLRMLGFDTLYHNGYHDRDIARISAEQDRIVLSRDRNLLIHKAVVRGCYLHARSCDQQLLEVMTRLNLSRAVRPFTRCLMCNGLLRDAGKNEVAQRLPGRSGQYYSRFKECPDCRRVYWEGSHLRRMREHVAHIVLEAQRLANERSARMVHSGDNAG